jgi:hypothetical protein
VRRLARKAQVSNAETGLDTLKSKKEQHEKSE